PLEIPAPAARPARPAWPWPAAVAAACLVAVSFAACWLVARDKLAKSRAEIAGLTSANAELQRARIDLSAAVKDLSTALATATAGAGAAGATAPMARAEPVPYGEIPFDRGRLDVLRELLAKLEAQGFHGVVKITSMS